jgi:hypothetical protein
MLNFKQYLEEGRDAPLYHATEYRALLNILITNKLEALNYHEFNSKIKKKHRNSWGDVKIISFTRNIRFARAWLNQLMGYGPILELDQRKLAQRYKFVPFNFFSYGARVDTDELGIDYDGDYGMNFPYNQFEENVIGDIKNLDKYLTKIIVVDDRWKSDKIISSHPLLYDLKTKRFINA